MKISIKVVNSATPNVLKISDLDPNFFKRLPKLPRPLSGKFFCKFEFQNLEFETVFGMICHFFGILKERERERVSV